MEAGTERGLTRRRIEEIERVQTLRRWAAYVRPRPLAETAHGKVPAVAWMESEGGTEVVYAGQTGRFPDLDRDDADVQNCKASTAGEASSENDLPESRFAEAAETLAGEVVGEAGLVRQVGREPDHVPGDRLKTVSHRSSLICSHGAYAVAMVPGMTLERMHEIVPLDVQATSHVA